MVDPEHSMATQASKTPPNPPGSIFSFSLERRFLEDSDRIDRPDAFARACDATMQHGRLAVSNNHCNMDAGTQLPAHRS